MNNKNKQIKSNDTQPCVGLVFEYDNGDEEVKTRLLVDTPEEEQVTLSPLSPKETKLRTECEKSIDEGLVAIFEVGCALFNIKTQKLYRSTHHFFEQYCKEKWGISRVHANRSIEAYRTERVLKSEPIGSVSVPDNESQARSLAGLTPKEKVTVAKKVKTKVGDRKPTAKDFKQARDETTPANTKPPTPKKDKPANVIPLPVIPKASSGSRFLSPSEFHNNTPLPSLKELSEVARKLSDTEGSSAKTKESQKLILQLKKWLPLYAEWEQQCLIPFAAMEQGAA